MRCFVLFRMSAFFRTGDSEENVVDELDQPSKDAGMYFTAVFAAGDDDRVGIRQHFTANVAFAVVVLVFVITGGIVNSFATLPRE